MGLCRKVEDAARQSRAELYKASLFDTGRDEVRRKPVAAALESYNNLMTKYPAHESILKPLVSGLEGTNESHIHGRCHDYYANQVKTAASGAPAAAASAATSQAARPAVLYACVSCVPGSPRYPHPLTRLCVWRLPPARLLVDPGVPGSTFHTPPRAGCSR